MKIKAFFISTLMITFGRRIESTVGVGIQSSSRPRCGPAQGVQDASICTGTVRTEHQVAEVSTEYLHKLNMRHRRSLQNSEPSPTRSWAAEPQLKMKAVRSTDIRYSAFSSGYIPTEYSVRVRHISCASWLQNVFHSFTLPDCVALALRQMVRTFCECFLGEAR
ncbi:hypothetical protein VTN31DRAFT_5160 [Thermomyces dupontii]|uniref:uncharacterized protein n=1 Tax=Talaromyces thermophilus TaxID=28565 RepID=UPI0037428BAB